jgi:hypothetical protein
VHLETLAGVPGVQPVILSDVVEPVLKEVTAQYGVPNYTLEADEVIHHPEVQAVSRRGCCCCCCCCGCCCCCCCVVVVVVVVGVIYQWCRF